MAAKQDAHISANPYSIKHPQWKHWSLGVLVFRGALTAAQVISWEYDSPASTAFWQGHEAARQAEKAFNRAAEAVGQVPPLPRKGVEPHDRNKGAGFSAYWNPIQAHINGEEN